LPVCLRRRVNGAPAPTGKEAGIEGGLQVVLVTADGDRVENLRYYRNAERERMTAQHQVARREQGGYRCATAAAQCARHHQHVRRHRQDFHLKTALAPLRRYDAIFIEPCSPPI
jgi:putative transposase